MSRTLSIFVRVLAIMIIAIAPWLEPMKRPSTTRSIVYVVDRSASLGDKGLDDANEYLGGVWTLRRNDTQLGVVAFDGHAELVAPLGTLSAPRIRESADPWASDLASGIRLAIGALPPKGHRTIVLMTDARSTRGDAAVEVRHAADLGIRVDVVPLDGPDAAMPTVVSVKARASHVAEHQPVALDVDVRANQPYVINWTRDGHPMPPAYQSSVDATKVELHDPDPPPGIHVYEVKASDPYRAQARRPAADDDDGSKKLPSPLTAVSVEGKAHAAVFTSSEGVPPVLKSALEEAGLDARPLTLDRLSDPTSYSGADLVVLSDVRVSGAATDEGGLTRTSQTALVDYVNQGGGLLVTGGVFGLAPEYAGTPLARALPIEIEDRGHVEDPPVSLAIMLDRSGSMAAMAGTHTKIELAIEASLAAADVLRQTDHVAIASVDTETHWDVPLGTVDRLASLRAGVRRVEAGGGGIYVYTALKDAYGALDKIKTPIRHVILFSDTSDSEEQAEGCSYEPCEGSAKTAEKLAHAARVRGITTTVVGIGEEEAQHTPFLRRLAAAAGGRFYLTTEGTDLRRIFLSETRVLAQSNLRDRKTNVFPAGPHPVLEGIDASKLPELGAYVETGRRAGADTALLLTDPARPEGRPMLATWRYGLGKTGVLTTDLSEGWGGAWAASPAAAQVLKQTVRFLLRQHAAHRADTTVRMHDRIVEVDFELPPDAPESAAPRSVDLFAVEKSGASRKIEAQLEPTGPGRWTVRARTNGERIVIVRARDARGVLMAEALGREDRMPELVGGNADLSMVEELARLGEGRVSPSPEATLYPTAKPARELVATWPYALVVAAFLVVIDLVLRRFGQKRQRGAPISIESLYNAPA